MGAGTRTKCGSVSAMARSRKVTLEVPAELLEKPQEVSGAGITRTVRVGPELVAASRAYARLRQLPGVGAGAIWYARVKS